MTMMTPENEKNWFDGPKAILHWVLNSYVWRFIVWARWFISIGLMVYSLLWSAYILGQDISENMTSDYSSVEIAQSNLLGGALRLRDNLLNPNIEVKLDQELEKLRELSLNTIAKLGGLRAPSNRIDIAKRNYRKSLEQLIAIANRLSRGDIKNMVLPLHNALVDVANTGGALNTEVSRFQGGMWPQLWAAVF